MQSVSLCFINNRKGKGSEKCATPIELRLSFNRKTKYVSTGIKVVPSQWKDGIVVKHPEASVLNTKLSDLMRKVNKIVMQMEEDGMIDFEAIPILLKTRSCTQTFWEFVEQMAWKKNVSDGTRAHYVNFINKLKEWNRFKTFAELTESNIKDYDRFLHRQDFKQSTIYGYHKMLKQFINDAICDKFLTVNPYTTSRLKLDKGESGIGKFLTEEEVAMLADAKLTGTLANVRDLFVFVCYTGLSYSDLMEFSKDSVTIDSDNTWVIEGERIKTGKDFVIPVLPQARELILKYDWNLPKFSNQKYNQYLKDVAIVAGIEKPITSHYARHTAGMILLNNGVPIAIVSKFLGHASVSTTEKYYARVRRCAVVRDVIGNSRLNDKQQEA